jgi:hypothetical protein
MVKSGGSEVMEALRDPRRFLMQWLAIVGVICLALIPIRVYALNANDWLVYLLLALGVVFLVAFVAVWKVWKPRALAVKPTPSPSAQP